MSHIMIDLETLGTLPGSVILSIGAVEFDPTKTPDECIGREFYCVLNRASCEEHGMNTSASTLEWWSKQSAAARKVLDDAMDAEVSVSLKDGLLVLADFIPSNAKVWSNGANFDQPLLDVAYSKVGVDLPWKFWNSRCHRTIVNLYPNERSIRPAAVVAHNALEDAKWQAKHLVNLAQKMNISLA